MIIRRLLEVKALRRLSGTLVAVPVVNVYGLIHQSRYLPDRRDLNRSFPGSAEGSLAARVAHLFIDEIVRHCSHGIDLHTGAIHRTNLPQIRANLNDTETERLAIAWRSFSRDTWTMKVSGIHRSSNFLLENDGSGALAHLSRGRPHCHFGRAADTRVRPRLSL